MEFLAERTSIYHNRKRLEGSRLREGDKIYLIRRNIRIMRLSEKLNYKKFGPFEITRYIKGINFELRLLLIMKIYPVFYISLLKPAHPKTLKGSIPEISPET